MPTSTTIATPAPTPPISSTTTLRHPPYTYLHLVFTAPAPAPSSSAPPSAPAVDAITARATLHRALSSALGLHGAAVPLDVLHVRGRECWVRVPRGDGKAVSAALAMGSGGGGGREGGGKELGVWVKGRGCTLGALLAGDEDAVV